MKKFLEKNIDKLLDGRKIKYRDRVFWLNSVYMDIYAVSAEAYETGVKDGYRVAHVNDDNTVTITE